jgi:long-chain fatty acid transport protein
MPYPMRPICALLALVLFPSTAIGGGFEFPESTAEALGRGGAFIAKADNTAAMYFNPAGLARQRGTRTLLDLNVIVHDRAFARAGSYPGDAGDPATPFSGQPYPAIANQGGPQWAPSLGVSTDFGRLRRWTFGIGVFGPSSYGRREYPATVEVSTPGGTRTAPSPARYDLLKADLIVVLPTLSAAVQVTRWFDLGLSVHIAAGSFDLQSYTFTDFGRNLCPYVEYHRCDALTRIKTSGASATASLGMLFTPVRALQIGVSVRGPLYLTSTGTLEVASPPAMPSTIIPPTTVTFVSNLPWIVRLGVRYAFVKDRFERGDIELDGVYEAWHAAQGDGSRLHADDLFPKGEIDLLVRHNYRDTFSVRLGGAYNIQLPRGVLTARLGFAFDSAATRYPDTRLDFNTGMKLMPAVGLAYRIRGVTINLAYAYLYEPDRHVVNGELRGLNAFGVCPPSMPACTNPTSNDSQGQLLPTINNGYYTSRTMTVSAGVTVHWDEALGRGGG